ncbi:MAG: imidazole glycerol phosphate synthase subunit HisH [Methanoregula sp.]
MKGTKKPVVAIVDMGLGNLFSVKNACEYVGMNVVITSSSSEIHDADAVILPGVGAFGDAMNALENLALLEVLDETVNDEKPLIGICLGMQLLMSEGTEFGSFKGLDYIEGNAVRFENPHSDFGTLKVPEICWNQMFKNTNTNADPWSNTPLDGLPDGVFMYFNHSYYVRPVDLGVIIATTTYGNTRFCSAMRKGKIFGFQPHPERSGSQGLHVYKKIASMIECSM